MMKRNLIVANWKMNPNTISEAKDIFGKIKRFAKKLKNSQVVVAPSFIHISSLSRLVPSKNIFLGAQNIHQKDFGPCTGEVSLSQLREFKIRYAILGHSERRAMGETDAAIGEKAQTALRFGVTPIICVGEKERDMEGAYLSAIRNQLYEIFAGIQKRFVSDCIIAYEPVWAIGHSFKDSLSPNDMHEMSLFIRKVMSEIFGRDFGWKIRVLYGGSVEPENARELMEKGDIKGFLVGHASLEFEKFKKILEEGDSVK
jgi:triosephosphate isomerase